MITITARIDLISGGNISGATSNFGGNNISGGLPYGDNKVAVGNPFILGASKLGEGATFEDRVGYFIGEMPSDENGNFSAPYELSIESSTPLKSLTVAFDTQNMRHPEKINLTLNKTVRFVSYGKFGGGYPIYYYFAINIPQQSTPPFEFVESSIPIIEGKSPKIKFVEYREAQGYIYEFEYDIPDLNSNPSQIEVAVAFDESKKKKKEIFDDDSIFTIQIPENISNIVTLEIPNWNAPNFPLVISGIYTNISLDINRRNLISFSRSIFDRSDHKRPSYGIISNTGNIEFNDLNGEIADYAEQLLLTSDLSVVAHLNNTLAKTSEKIGVFETREWDYDNDNRSVSVSLKDDLEEWQDISVEGFSYDPRKPFNILENGTMADLYRWLYNATPSKYKMLSLAELDEQTRTILGSTSIRYPLLESATLWRQWQKLCEVCALYIYKNNEGRTVCTYTYGS